MDVNSRIKKFLAIRGVAQVVTVTFGLILLCIVFSILNPKFFSPSNMSNLLRQISPILLIGIGQSFVLITGNIDLSLGSVVGMSCMMSATLMTHNVAVFPSVLITLICCLAFGVLNGLLVAQFKLPPFIATLGTMVIARGIAQIVNGNYNTNAIPDSADGFSQFFYYGKIPGTGIYSPVVIAIVLWVIFNFILSRTRTGRHIYAIGSNIDAARLSGVNVVATTVKAYVVSSFMAFVVGVILCATSRVGTMDAGNMYEMYAVAASVIGGVSTLGGQGILAGTIVGAAIWQVLQNGLQFAGAPVALRNIVIGIIVILSVLLDILIRSGKHISFKKKSAA